jgi:hypothetical protein
MAENEPLLWPVPGAQVGFRVPERPKSLLNAIKAIRSNTERKRAQNAWNTALDLQLLIQLWMHFLCLGMLQQRLNDETEDAIYRYFPQLANLGGVLNRLAQEVQIPVETAQRLCAFDTATNIKRGPTGRHQHDNPKDFDPTVIGQLAETFRILMRTAAERLNLLEVRQEAFQRPRDKLREEVDTLTSLDMDFTGDCPRLDFGKALQDERVLQVRGYLMGELKALIEQLQTHPEVILSRPQQEAAGRARRSGGMPRAKADEKVRSYLSAHPEASSKEIAQAIGCSESQVRSTPAWKNRPNQRSPRGRGLGKKMGYDQAIENKSVQDHKEQEDQENSAEDEPGDRDQEIARLAKEQERDHRADNRRPRRRNR